MAIKIDPNTNKGGWMTRRSLREFVRREIASGRWSASQADAFKCVLDFVLDAPKRANQKVGGLGRK